MMDVLSYMAGQEEFAGVFAGLQSMGVTLEHLRDAFFKHGIKKRFLEGGDANKDKVVSKKECFHFFAPKCLKDNRDCVGNELYFKGRLGLAGHGEVETHLTLRRGLKHG